MLSGNDDTPSVRVSPRHRLYDITDVELVGAIPEAVCKLIALSDDARLVRLHPDTVAHIVQQRSGQDADFVFANLANAVARPAMIGVEIANYKKLRLVHRVEGAPRWLHIALKLVLAIDSKSGNDEIWVSTGYAMGRSVFQLRNKPTAWYVIGGLGVELG